jgi:hypothetical protein
MKTIKDFNSFVNEKYKSFSEYPYQLYHNKNQMASAIGGKSEKELINQAKKLELKRFEIFKNNPRFHSTTQEEYLVSWYDKDGDNYWSNRSKKEPELLKKRLDDSIMESLMDELMKDDKEGNKPENKENDINSQKPVTVLWADKIIDSFARASKKAKVIGRGGKNWDREYVTNANHSHGTVFFIDAENKEEALNKIQDCKKFDSYKNVYYNGSNSLRLLNKLSS